MYHDIVDQIKWKAWAKPDLRYRRLDILDRLQEGTLYDHLLKTYRQETEPNGAMITMEKRKPSTKFNLARMVSTMVSRKLFAGRHAPTISHQDNPKVAEAVRALAQEGRLESIMLQACNWGAVGSVAVPFKILPQQTRSGAIPRLIVDCYKPKFCTPVFDVFKELKKLRIQYLVPGHSLLMDDFQHDYRFRPIEPRREYWFIKDLTTEEEIRYLPILENDWIPIDNKREKLIEDEIVPHGLGFVPAHWFINLAGGTYPDGACTFEDAKENIVLIDYTMSGLGLGVSYNSSPQVVIVGQPINYEDEHGQTIYRGPTRYLQFEPEHDRQDGGKEGRGSAELMEMTGEGIKVGINDFVRELKKMAMEQIAASRKDPDKVTTAMSGKGIELIEQEFLDLVYEQRTSYGEEGYLKLLKKTGVAAIDTKHPLMKDIRVEDLDGITLEWPPLYDLGPAEFQQLMAGLKDAIAIQLLSEPEARNYMRAQIDVPEQSANKTYAEGLSGGAHEKGDDPAPEQPALGNSDNFSV